MTRRQTAMDDLCARHLNITWQELTRSHYVILTQQGYYWRENSCGYGPLSVAGVYSFDEALSIEANGRKPWDHMVPLQTLREEIIEILHGAAALMRHLL